MRIPIVIALGLMCSIPLAASEADTKLRSELESLHAKWFKAFDAGQGAEMDQIEAEGLKLVMPTGIIWTKTKSRASEPTKRDSDVERRLSDVSVRQFGDTAVLTGILTTKSGSETKQEATTAVFVRSSGTWKIAAAQWTPVVGAK
jgi:ketosteroid isomerase-like protein